MWSWLAFVSRALPTVSLAVAVVACAAPDHAASTVKLGIPGDFVGQVVGPIQRGQPGEGAGFKSYELKLPASVSVDDKADCGPQDVASLPIEKEGMEVYVGKTVRLKATAYCRTDRTGTYHLRDVSVH